MDPAVGSRWGSLFFPRRGGEGLRLGELPAGQKESPSYRLDTNVSTQVRRGHPIRRWDPKPELWFFAIRIAEHFEFERAWYRGAKVRAFVLTYYLLLRSILRANPHLRRCLKRCGHCRIFFLTDPRNAGRKDERDVGRKDLRCPFGCSQAHRKQQSTRRSVQFYREHKKKKQFQNGKRRVAATRRPLKKQPKEPAPSAKAIPWQWKVVEHVRVVVSLIEGRRMSLKEILQMLTEVLRQHGLARRRKIDQAVSWLHENPP